MPVNRIESNRVLCIKKDLIELSNWIENIEGFNDELVYLKLIEAQIVKNDAIAMRILSFRRKNTLTMGAFCKYEQELKKELEYGQRNYDISRAKMHEKKREEFIKITRGFNRLKQTIYNQMVTRPFN